MSVQLEIISDFMSLDSFPLLLLSYELLRKHGPALSACTPPISSAYPRPISHSNPRAGFRLDLLVCDEGHRRKNSGGSKTLSALSEVAANTPRRIILSGTPVQNNLDELYAMCNFVCPGILGITPLYY
jgi:SNF2 family DNA or RNA helicase